MMKKIVLLFFFILILFTLYASDTFAACQISAPDSAERNSQITVTVSQVPPGTADQTPGLSVRDSNGNEVGCYTLAWPEGVSDVGLPSTGTYATLRVEMRECPSGQFCGTCGKFISGPECTKTINLTGAPPPSPSCSVSFAPNEIYVTARNLDCANSQYCFIAINPKGFMEANECKSWVGGCTGSITVTFIPQVYWKSGTYTIEVRTTTTTGNLITSCNFTYTAPGTTPAEIGCDICGCENKPEKTVDCPNCNPECYNCVYKEGKSWTAFRCLPTNDPQAFIAWLLGGAIGIAGGIAFLLMLWGGFQIITSTGDPEKLNKGKEILTSAIIGLVVIIFSLFLLQLIGVKILQIPGFGTP